MKTWTTKYDYYNEVLFDIEDDLNNGPSIINRHEEAGLRLLKGIIGLFGQEDFNNAFKFIERRQGTNESYTYEQHFRDFLVMITTEKGCKRYKTRPKKGEADLNKMPGALLLQFTRLETGLFFRHFKEVLHRSEAGHDKIMTAIEYSSRKRKGKYQVFKVSK